MNTAKKRGAAPWNLGLALLLLDRSGRLLDQDIEFLGEAVASIGEPLKALGKLTVDRGDGRSAGVVRPATLFYRPSSVVVSIVRHQG